MRTGQWAAALAAVAHFTTSNDPALLVLPTGLGKTALMTLLPYLLPSCARVLVVAPTRVVRKQISDEFKKLPTLRRSGVFSDADKLPAPQVCVVESMLTSKSAWESAAQNDVVVGLPQSLSPGVNGIASPPANLFDLVIVDEAHHVEAVTWDALVEAFHAKKVYLTATPFRRDRRRIKAKHVYNYPLALALQEGLYSPIEYRPVAIRIGDDRDQALAAEARKRLETRKHAGAGSRVLVRTDRIADAEALQEVYAKLGVPLGLITGEMKPTAIDGVIREVRDGTLRGIVFVGVLGEGFDLPELKIAVYHRPHQSLPATLQFVGRVARTKGSALASAELLAPADDRPRLMSELYQDDADWSALLPKLFEVAMKKGQKDTSFNLHGSGSIDIADVRPFFGAKVFDVQTAWALSVSDLPPGTEVGDSTIDGLVESDGSATAVVTRHPQTPRWCSQQLPFGEVGELSVFVLVKRASAQRLFFYSTEPDSTATELLKRASGGDLSQLKRVAPVELRKALASFTPRTFVGVGLRGSVSRNASYRTVVGRDAGQGITVQESRVHFFGHAMALGATSDGTSGSRQCGISVAKGSVWQTTWGSLEDYRDWCIEVGSAMLAKAPPAAIPLDLAFPQALTKLPTATPLGAVLDPWFLVDREGREIRIVTNDKQVPVGATSVSVECTKDIMRLTISSEGISMLVLDASVDGAFKKTGGGELYAGRRTSRLNADSLFANHPPTVFFSDGSVVQGHMLHIPQSPGELLLTQPHVFKPMKWTGCEITAEKPANVVGAGVSIFDYVREQLRTSKAWRYILTDDGAHEIGDFLAIAPGVDTVRVLIVHCKAMKTNAPSAASVTNLNEVVAQAIRSQNHLQMPPAIFWPEIRRRLKERAATKLLWGQLKALSSALDSWAALPLEVDVAIVQPGLSYGALVKKGGSNARILLESVLGLSEQVGGRLEVWCSE